MSGPRLRIDLDAFAANIARRARRASRRRSSCSSSRTTRTATGIERDRAPGRREGVRWFGAFDVREALRAATVAGAEARVFSWLTVGPTPRSRTRSRRGHRPRASAMPDFLEDIAAVAAGAGAAARVHLKIDTGLHRNGIRPEEWAAVARPRARARAGRARARRRACGATSPRRATPKTTRHARVFDDAVDRGRGGGIRPRGASSRRERRVVRARRSSATTSSASERSATASGRPSGPAEADLGIRPIAALRAPVTHVGDRARDVGVGCAARSAVHARRRARRSRAPGGAERGARRPFEPHVVAAWPRRRRRRRGRRVRCRTASIGDGSRRGDRHRRRGDPRPGLAARAACLPRASTLRRQTASTSRAVSSCQLVAIAAELLFVLATVVGAEEQFAAVDLGGDVGLCAARVAAVHRGQAVLENGGLTFGV